MDLPTLLGLAEHPGELVGYGPIPASVARKLAADGAWRRWVTDPVSGYLLDYGTSTYAPPRVLRDFLVAAHPRCVAPHCPQPSRRADLDHLIPFDLGDAAASAGGGVTSADNLRPECRGHHLLKTLGHVKITTGHGGGVTWTTSTGRIHHLEPTDHRHHSDDPPEVERDPHPDAGK